MSDRGVLREEIPKEVPVHELGSGRVRYALLPVVRLCRSLRPDVVISTVGHLNLLLLMAGPLLPRSCRVMVRAARMGSPGSSTSGRPVAAVAPPPPPPTRGVNLPADPNVEELYTLQVTLPPYCAFSTTCLEDPNAPLDPTGQPSPLVLGPYNVGGYINPFDCGSNPFYRSFALSADDPTILNNNIPLLCDVGAAPVPAPAIKYLLI